MCFQSLKRMGREGQETVGLREQDQSFNWLQRKRDFRSNDGSANDGRRGRSRQKTSALERAKQGQIAMKDILAVHSTF